MHLGEENIEGGAIGGAVVGETKEFEIVQTGYHEIGDVTNNTKREKKKKQKLQNTLVMDINVRRI